MRTVMSDRRRALRSIIYVLGGAAVMLLLSTRSLIAGGSQEAKVTNVRFQVDHGQVRINYDLAGDPGARYRVSVLLRNGNDSGYSYSPRAITGDVGVGNFAGVNREIVWNISDEFPDGLPGSDYYFVVRAEKITEISGPSLLAVMGTGAAVLAAAVTYFVISGLHSPGAQAAQGLPIPPGRPQ